nr:hypothetical protein CFP56_78696 [Quercus suber]
MDRTTWPFVGGFVAGVVQLTQITPTTFAFDKLVHTAICLFAVLAITIALASKVLLRFDSSLRRTHEREDDAAIPLNPSRDPNSPIESPSDPLQTVQYSTRSPTLKSSFLILVAAIPCRVILWRQILVDWQCAKSEWSPLLPLVYSVLDIRKRSRDTQAVVDEDDPNSSIYDAITHKITRSQYRYILATSLLGLGSMTAMSFTGGLQSTYICPTTSYHRWLVPAEQLIGFLLDIVVVLCVEQLLYPTDHNRTRSLPSRFLSVAWALLVNTLIHTIGDHDLIS